MNERELFFAALQIEDLAGRRAYLGNACADSGELRQRVEALLAAHGQAGSFLQQPAEDLAVTLSQPLAEGPSSQIGPYKLLEQIGEGGMGVVFMAEQTRPMRRRVALKIIKAGMDTRAVIARFEAERQALAMMDHPNIARVFDAGATDMGRPYFVMELVRGVPMTEFCNQKNLSIRERLELFISVCQAVQHAHQKGIIHRDIKPTNVLVTLHDGRATIKVIDFGVAKATGQKLTDKTLFTGFNQMIGTPLYMSPEQAEMTSQDVDTRSDIFSAGVLLYELLAGTTPFDGARLKSASFDELRRIIREEEPPRPSTRLTALGLETASAVGLQRKSDPRQLTRLLRGELDWIVMKCLEKDRTRRYETASALATEVERYLHDEPVQACPPSTFYRFRKFARRNKRGLTTAVIVGVMLLVAMGTVAGSFGWVMRDKAARIAKASDAIENALRDAGTLQAHQKWSEALAVVKQAQVLLANGGDEDLRKRLIERIADLEMILKLEHAFSLRIASLKDDGKRNYEHTDAAYARAFREYGIDVAAIGPGEAGQLLQRRSIRVELAVALDGWARTLRDLENNAWRDRLAVARAADPDPFRDRVRNAISREDQKAFWELADADQIADLSGPTLVFLIRVLGDAGTPTDGVALLKKAQRRSPGDFGVNMSLGYQLAQLGPSHQDDCIRYFSAALALRPENSILHDCLGNALRRAGRLKEAIAEFEQAIRCEKDSATSHCNFGVALLDARRLDEATAEFREAVRLDPDFADGHDNLGTAYYTKRQLDDAIAEFKVAIQLDRNVSLFHNNIGGVLYDMGRFNEAAVELREAIRLKSDFDLPHANLGQVYIGLNRLDEAVAEFREAIRLNHKHVEGHEDLAEALNRQDRPDEAIAEGREALAIDKNRAMFHVNLGVALGLKGRPEEAIGEFREAIRLDKTLPAAHINLGGAFMGKGQFDEAVAEFREAIRLKDDGADAHAYLGDALVGKGRLDEAIAECSKALSLRPDNCAAHSALGSALLARRDFDKAIAEFREAVRLRKDSFETHTNLGTTLIDNGQLDEGIAECREAVRLKNDSAVARYNLGRALLARRDFDKAIAELREAIRIDKDYADAHGSLGIALLDRKQFDEAITEFREAIRLKKDDAGEHKYLGHALFAKGQLDEAITEFREAIRLKKDDAEGHHFLGTALALKGQQDEAIVEFREAIRLKKDFAEAYKNLCLFLTAQGKTEEAIAAATEAIRLDPKDAQSLNQLAWLLATCKEVKFRDPIRAVELAKNAFGTAPKDGGIWNTLGVAHYRAGHWQDAAAALEKSMELRKGGDANDWFFLSMADWQMNRQKESRQWYDQAVEWMERNQPQDANLRRWRGEAGELLEVKQ